MKATFYAQTKVNIDQTGHNIHVVSESGDQIKKKNMLS